LEHLVCKELLVFPDLLESLEHLVSKVLLDVREVKVLVV